MTRRTSVTLLAALCTAAVPAISDVKISADYNTDGKHSATTIYSNGARLRYEYGNGFILLRQCDLSRIVQIDDKARTYLTLPAEVPAAAVPAPVDSAPATKMEVTDTNERKDMFGYQARHLKITGTAAARNERTETDGWYVNLKNLTSCNSQPAGPSAESGYPVAYTITTYAESGKPSSTVSMRVTGLVTGPLDAALFEVPGGYSESNPLTAPASKLAPKSTGAVRIGAVGLDNQSSQKVQTAGAYNQLIGQLQAAQFEVVPLPNGTPDAIQQKAQQAECDYILYTELDGLDKPAAGKVGGFLHKAPAIGHITGGDVLEAKVSYRLVPAAGGSPVMASSVTSKSGSSFDWKSAAMLASNVMPMTMAMRMMGGAFNPMMMNSLLGGHGSGAAILGMDPMMSSLTMFLKASNGTPGLPGLGGAAATNPAGADVALGAAFDQIGKAVIAQLKRPTN